MDPMDFSGKSVIVTGGTKGVGRVITQRFLAAGAEVTICARNPPDGPVAEQRLGQDVEARFVRADVRQPDDIAAVVEAVVARAGAIDVLVNNAGGAPPASSATASPRFNERVVALNLLAPLMFSQAVQPIMAGRGGGVIVNLSSVSGMRANPMGVAYGAAKAGLINATETLAVEWGPEVRVLALTAGPLVTEEAELFYGDDEGVAAVGATIALGRMGTPADIADVCLFLASPLARWMSGSNVVVDGGGERPAYLDASTGSVTRP